MYHLSGNPFTLEALYEYYAALDCHTFDKLSLVRTQLQHSTTPTDTEAETTEHSLSATEMSAFTQAMINTFVASDTHAYPLQELVARINSDNDTVNQMAVALWIEHFRLLFTEEENPLALLSTFPEQCATPIQMSAALSVLIEREIDVHEILASGLLQDYGKLNINNMSSVEKTYKRVFPDENDERLSVISRVPLSLTAQPVDTRATTATYVISGKFREDAFMRYQVDIHKPELDWESITQTRLTTLIQMIGPEVMVQALRILASQRLSGLSQHVEAILAEHTEDELAYLFQYISTQVSAEDDLRNNCLTELSEHISDESALSLLRHLDISPWVLLSSKPNLIGQLTQEDLDKITSPLRAASDEPSRPFIAPHEINAAVDVASDTDCDATLSENIYLTIAKIYLNTTQEIALDDDVLSDLDCTEVVQRWVRKQGTQLNTQWHEVLQVNVPTLLTRENSYQNILDLGQSLRRLIRRLQQLGLDDTPIPLNVNDQDARILLLSIEHYDSTDYTDEGLQAHIESVLSLMQPFEKYYREPPPVNRIQADEQNELRDIGRLAAQETAREAVKRTLKREAEEHVALAKARLLLMASFLGQNDACCQLLFDTEKPYKAHISKLITRDNLIQAYTTFSDTQLSDFRSLSHLRLGDVIISVTQLEQALQFLSEAQSHILLDRLGDDLSRIITNGKGLELVFRFLNEAKRDAILARLPADLSRIITNGQHLGLTLQFLNDAQSNILLDKLPANLINIITNGEQLGQALKYSNEATCNVILARIPVNLSSIITNGFQLCCALEHLSGAQRNTVLQTLPTDLSHIINNAEQLNYALRYLSEAQCHTLLDKLPANLSRIITNGEQLGYALLLLNQAQRNTVLQTLPTDLSHIINNAEQLNYALRYLSEAQCHTLLDKLPANLSRIITNGEQLGYALLLLNQAQRNALLDKLPDGLSGIINDGEQLVQALKCLSEEKRNDILVRLPADLSHVITDGKQLSSVLEYLNAVQCNIILEGIRGRLPTLLPNGYTGVHEHLVNQKLDDVKHYKGRFFELNAPPGRGSTDDFQEHSNSFS